MALRDASAVAFVQLHRVDALRVFRLVAVAHDVAPVVVRLAYQPVEGAARVGRVEHAALRRAAVPGGDVVARDRAPEGVGRVGSARPALDACEQPLDARAIARHLVGGAEGGARLAARLKATRLACEFGNQVFGAGENEDVGIGAAGVLRNALVGLARDRRQAEAPSEAERTVAGGGVVSQRQCRSEAGTARTDSDRDRHRAAASHRVSGELLADAADRATTLRQRETGLGNRSPACAGTRRALHETDSLSRSRRRDAPPTGPCIPPGPSHCGSFLLRGRRCNL